MMSLMCFDTETKDKLIANGYKYLCEKNIGNKIAYVFLNNGKHLEFEKNKVVFTNKMYF